MVGRLLQSSTPLRLQSGSVSGVASSPWSTLCVCPTVLLSHSDLQLPRLIRSARSIFRYSYVRIAKDALNRMTQSFFPSRVQFQSYEPIRAATSHTMERRYWNENIDFRFAHETAVYVYWRRARIDVDLLTFHVSLL